jgi:hypothetical protein
MVERQLRYNKFTDTGEQTPLRHRWTFAILNEPREIERIEQRLFNQLSHCDDLRTNYEKSIKSSGGLYIKIISFSSEKGRIANPQKVYDQPKKFKKDRDLRDVAEEKLENYVKRLIS